MSFEVISPISETDFCHGHHFMCFQSSDIFIHFAVFRKFSGREASAPDHTDPSLQPWKPLLTFYFHYFGDLKLIYLVIHSPRLVNTPCSGIFEWIFFKSSKQRNDIWVAFIHMSHYTLLLFISSTISSPMPSHTLQLVPFVTSWSSFCLSYPLYFPTVV